MEACFRRMHFGNRVIWLLYVFCLWLHKLGLSPDSTTTSMHGSKESTCNAGDTGDLGLIPGSGRFPWRRAWQPTPVFLLGKSHEQRSWQTLVHEVTKSQTQLNLLNMHAYLDTGDISFSSNLHSPGGRIKKMDFE